MKRTWLALLLAPVVLTCCGRDEQTHHDWDQKEQPSEPISKAAEEKPTSEVPVTAKEEEPEVKETDAVIFQASSELTQVDWPLYKVGDSETIWHFWVRSISENQVVVDVEHNMEIIEKDIVLSRSTSHKTDSVLYEGNFPAYFSTSRRFIFERSTITNECQARYIFKKYLSSEQQVLLYGSCAP